METSVPDSDGSDGQCVYNVQRLVYRTLMVVMVSVCTLYGD